MGNHLVITDKGHSVSQRMRGELQKKGESLKVTLAFLYCIRHGKNHNIDALKIQIGYVICTENTLVFELKILWE